MLSLDTSISPIAVDDSFDTSFASSGLDESGSISYDIPPASTALTLDPFLFPGGSASTSDTPATSGTDLLTPTQPAPQTATAGTTAGNTWAPLLGFGAPLVGATVGGLLKGATPLKATGASVGLLAAGSPLKTFLDTTNQGITGQQVVIGGIVLLALVYGINKLV